MLSGLFIGGLVYPTYAAAAGAVFAVARIPFTLGYISGDPKKRGGFFGILTDIALVALLLILIGAGIRIARLY